MKHVYLLLFMLIGANSFSQIPEFEFQLYFEDAAGNKDTITLGYDPSALETINPQFGEVNIKTTPIDTASLDVRATEGLISPGDDQFNFKKRIIPYDCAVEKLGSPIPIQIFTNHWPVNISWNKGTEFWDTCRQSSIFTSYHPGGWWDVGAPSHLKLYMNNITNQPITFYDNSFVPDYGYIDEEGNKITMFWFAFVKDFSQFVGSLSSFNPEGNKIGPYPNPFENSFNLPEDISPSKIQIRDIRGSKIEFEQKGNSINLINCNPGIYFLSFIANKQLYNFKIIKQ
ncbi:MAG: T9SS type A sorting domain-containing protein [Brumimicrobium sp.]|nr:T9SS type A sorting domain-containing protein [Brumimicrobium sp.]